MLYLCWHGWFWNVSQHTNNINHDLGTTDLLCWGRCSLRPTAVCLAHLSRTPLGMLPNTKNSTHLFFSPGFLSPESRNSVWTMVFHDILWRISGISMRFYPFPGFPTIGPCPPARLSLPIFRLATRRASQGLPRQLCGKVFIGVLPQLLAANRAWGKTSENGDVGW